MVPCAIVTDRLASYAAAKAVVMPTAPISAAGARTTASRTRTNLSASARSATVQEPEARCALLFRVQYGLQPVSARPPYALGAERSHGDAPTLAGVGRRLGDNGVRYRSVRSRPEGLSVFVSLFDVLRPEGANNLTRPSRGCREMTSLQSVRTLESLPPRRLRKRKDATKKSGSTLVPRCIMGRILDGQNGNPGPNTRRSCTAK
jgi:hypothetical protein